ncbi:hypothetical protein C5167_049232 [Papaver somniferum]|uniref:Uncharacterized protein n=1 Tax=Papaver somniferum TaxID=3469 RepID=A0A4Y7KMZ4_PAPSO|nr:hypothetical protein C5167_049232 [Papaver somniferum]
MEVAEQNSLENFVIKFVNGSNGKVTEEPIPVTSWAKIVDKEMIVTIGTETAIMNKFETALLSSLKTIIAAEFKAFGERLFNNKLGSSDDLVEAPSDSNSLADLNKVFDNRLSFSDGIDNTGTNSQLITDAGKLKSGYEDTDLVGPELIHSKVIEDEVDVNLKSIPHDSSDSSSKYNGNSSFLAYQEGKPFIPSTRLVVDSQSKSAAYHEANNFNSLNMNYNAEPQQFEDWKFSDGDNINRFTSNPQITAISVALLSSNPSRMIFDRGKKFVICDMCSHCARRNIKFCPEMFTSCLITPMDKYDEESFYDLIRQHGYQLDSSSTNSVVFVLVKDGDCYECENLFARMSDRGCITSYACECLMFDHYRVHHPNLWNSYLEALVAASLKLFQKLLNYMGSINYEMVHLNASSYVTGAAVVLVKTSQGDSEDCDTLVADIVHSIDNEVAGNLFDRGRLLKLITRCISGRSNVWVLIKTSGVHSCMGCGGDGWIVGWKEFFVRTMGIWKILGGELLDQKYTEVIDKIVWEFKDTVLVDMVVFYIGALHIYEDVELNKQEFTFKTRREFFIFSSDLCTAGEEGLIILEFTSGSKTSYFFFNSTLKFSHGKLPTALNMLLNSLNTSYSVIAGNQAQILLFMRSKSVVRNLEVGSCATHRLQLYRFVRLSRNQYYYPWEISKIIGRIVEGKEKTVKSMMSIGAIIIKEGMEQYEGKPVLQNNLSPVEVDLAFLNCTSSTSWTILVTTTILAAIHLITWYDDCLNKHRDTICSFCQLCSCVYGVLIREGNLEIYFHASIGNEDIFFMLECAYTVSSIAVKSLKAYQTVKMKRVGLFTEIPRWRFVLSYIFLVGLDAEIVNCVLYRSSSFYILEDKDDLDGWDLS